MPAAGAAGAVASGAGSAAPALLIGRSSSFKLSRVCCCEPIADAEVCLLGLALVCRCSASAGVGADCCDLDFCLLADGSPSPVPSTGSSGEIAANRSSRNSKRIIRKGSGKREAGSERGVGEVNRSALEARPVQRRDHKQRAECRRCLLLRQCARAHHVACAIPFTRTQVPLQEAGNLVFLREGS